MLTSVSVDFTHLDSGMDVTAFRQWLFQRTSLRHIALNDPWEDAWADAVVTLSREASACLPSPAVAHHA